MNNLYSNYKGKKVFITGITGFKGSWLALILKQLGAEVYGLGLDQKDSDSIFYKAEINNIAKIFIEDLQNELTECCKNSILESDYIFHLAAQPLVSEGYKNPLETFQTNLIGTVRLLELIKNTKKEIIFFNITTDKVYKPSYSPHTETEELFGKDPYSLSKSFSDMVTQMYKENILPQNVKVFIGRAGNVLGGGDRSKNRVFTDVFDYCFHGKPLVLRNPNSVRPYQFVLDCLMNYVLLATTNQQGAYNIGPDLSQNVTTEELVKSFEKVHGSICYETNGKSIGKEASFLGLNNIKILNLLKKPPLCKTIDDVTRYTYIYEKESIKGNALQEANRQVKLAIKEYGE